MPCACSAPCCSSPAPPAPRPLSRPARCPTGAPTARAWSAISPTTTASRGSALGSSWSTNGGAQRLCQAPRPRPRRTRLQRPRHRHVRRRQAHRAPAGRDGLHAGRDPGCRRRQGALPRRPGTAEAATADRSQPDRRDRLLLRRQDRPRHGPPGLPLAGVASFHGALGTATPASKGSVKAKILVEHGSADSLVPARTSTP